MANGGLQPYSPADPSFDQEQVEDIDGSITLDHPRRVVEAVHKKLLNKTFVKAYVIGKSMVTEIPVRARPGKRGGDVKTTQSAAVVATY